MSGYLNREGLLRRSIYISGFPFVFFLSLSLYWLIESDLPTIQIWQVFPQKISLYIHIYIYIPIHTQKGRKGQLSECFLKNHPFPMCWMTWHHDICSCDGASQTKWLSDTRAKRKGWSLLKTDVILALRFGDRRLIGHLAAEQAGFSDGTSKSDVSKASFKW